MPGLFLPAWNIWWVEIFHIWSWAAPLVLPINETFEFSVACLSFVPIVVPSLRAVPPRFPVRWTEDKSNHKIICKHSLTHVCLGSTSPGAPCLSADGNHMPLPFPNTTTYLQILRPWHGGSIINGYYSSKHLRSYLWRGNGMKYAPAIFSNLLGYKRKFAAASRRNYLHPVDPPWILLQTLRAERLVWTLPERSGRAWSSIMSETLLAWLQVCDKCLLNASGRYLCDKVSAFLAACR